jgi:peptidoglycan/LPS O-acetylase OafA/YrhL
MTERGFLGVDLFFVLSGFLIVTLLLRERDRYGAINLKNFYVRRTLRIFPIYYLELFAVTLAVLLFKPGTAMARDMVKDFPFLVTYTSNWAAITAVNFPIFWSLATEEQFYLAWPSIERYLKPPAVLAALAAALGINLLVNFGALDGVLRRIFGAGVSDRAFLDVTFTPILMGVVLAHVLNSERGYVRFCRWFGARWSPLVLIAGLLLLCEATPRDISGLPRQAIHLVMTLLVGALVVREDHFARPLLAFKPIARLGVISYGVYIYHMWGIHVVREVFERVGMPDSRIFFLAAVLVSALIAEGSYRFIESPLLKLKDRFGGNVVAAAPAC